MTPELEAEGLGIAGSLSLNFRTFADYIRASIEREKAADAAHEAFRREVSEIVRHLPNRPFVLDRFVIPPPPDPYEVKAREMVRNKVGDLYRESLIKTIAAALREAKEGK